MAFNPITSVFRHQVSQQQHTGRRLFSSALTPFRISLQRSPSFVQRRQLWGSSSQSSTTSNSHLAHLEQTANNNPRSATAQHAFYSALLRANRSDVVVQRYESDAFASNQACESLYLRAVDRVNTAPAKSDGMQSSNLSGIVKSVAAQASGANASTAEVGAGSQKNPVHVVLSESTALVIFRWVRFLLAFCFSIWSFYVVVTMFLAATEAGGLLRKMGGKGSEAKPEVQKTRFSDVHGCDEAKEELQEIVDFLKSPDKYATLGGKLPKGVLLVGPPGTGKTLLARAVAGEAGVPFFYMSGSEFDEVYVGVGAKRVRELFNAARAKAPAIVFIDELDAVGGKRNERDAAYSKQTLNQLLTDLDGFNQSSGVIFLAATNFPELLDKALTRPGRFDRQVVVGLPDVRGRIAILDFYMKKMSIGQNVDPSVLARGTPGFSGAELENLTNTAAVHASKRRASQIEMVDFEWAKDKILMGAERTSFFIQQKDKVMTAYHEGGHALVAMFTPFADPLYKATIMPRGHALGITFQLPEMDKVSMAKREYMAMLDVCMGGKIAEEIIYGPDATTGGASSDIERATSVAYAMVTQLGMSPAIGNVDLHSDYGRLPPETKQLIWQEVKRLIDESRDRAEALLHAKRKELDRLANALVEYETLGKDEMEIVIRGEKLPETLKGIPDTPIKLPEASILPGPREPPGAGGLPIPQGPTGDPVA
ncbi:intermembrane space AAA protease IAP-1 [Microthyrium microscopicum]|uniref:Intermembrane space AAA protease IAP-1 n=1 Tax=Microthyrium microscopicum TaxID=703497 RepID=A0A6A6USS7_9PEZI|nr:intermembrane space AAA protease IAP-1 [Microthyrium microscopicum]